MLPPIEEAIQAYTRAVEKGEVRCDVEVCLRCGKRPGIFKLKDRRTRSFCFIFERSVRKLQSFLCRWKCALCRKTFTLYPPFALPRKRYVLEDVLNTSRRYVEKEALSYRKVVKVRGMPVFHGSEDADDLRVFSHSTPHRWLGFLATLVTTTREALRLVRQKSPSSGVFRKIEPIAPWKYRSDDRRRVLQDARRLLVAEAEYRVLFGVSVFPRFATVCAWE